MKKVLNFFVNSKNGQKIFSIACAVIIISLVIGLILSIPIFWLGGKTYEETWMSSVAPYFFYVFFAYAAFILLLFIPYMWYVGNSKKYEGDGRKFLKGMAIFCSIAPGAFIYSFIAKMLFIPSGMHNLAGMLVCGVLYLWIVKTMFKKPFGIAQDFIPLS
jgi:hypothetical protein